MSDITIALDAGHGGSDPGAVYNGRAEKMIHSALPGLSERYLK